MRIFLFAASLRKDSYNKKLIRIAADIVKKMGTHRVDLCEFNEFLLPLYDGDLELQQGIPDAANKLGDKIKEADAVIISSPEYNGSIPGTLKNALDWISRIKPVPLAKKQVFLIGASPGKLGAVRGNLHTRVPFHILGSHVFPDYFGVALADEAFDAKGNFKDPRQRDSLKKLLESFIFYAGRKETPFDRLDEFIDEQKGKNPSP